MGIPNFPRLGKSPSGGNLRWFGKEGKARAWRGSWEFFGAPTLQGDPHVRALGGEEPPSRCALDRRPCRRPEEEDATQRPPWEPQGAPQQRRLEPPWPRFLAKPTMGRAVRQQRRVPARSKGGWGPGWPSTPAVEPQSEGGVWIGQDPPPQLTGEPEWRGALRARFPLPCCCSRWLSPGALPPTSSSGGPPCSSRAGALFPVSCEPPPHSGEGDSGPQGRAPQFQGIFVCSILGLLAPALSPAPEKDFLRPARASLGDLGLGRGVRRERESLAGTTLPCHWG